MESEISVNMLECFGRHECEVATGGEAHLHKHFTECTKNPGHVNFIPISSFELDDLPEGHRDQDLFALIKASADLTVRVAVRKVSPFRPKFWPNTDTPYPFNDSGGNDDLRTGSGKITVCMYKDGCGFNGRGSKYNLVGEMYDALHQKCPCEQCQHLDTPSRVWWEIIVTTAAHVVFDDVEAKHTSCRLFFDDRDSPLVNLDKFVLANVDIERDRCQIKYVTCDESLGNTLYKMATLRVELWDRVLNQYAYRKDNKLIFIVSHPHGCPKQVSVGEWKENCRVREYNDEYDLTKLTYTTSTCPGSSGARVYSVGFIGASHVHNGTLESGLNHSSVDLYKRD